MKNTHIYSLIALVSFALMGLIVIQLYWINNAIELRKNNFASDIRTSLDNISDKLERLDALKQVDDYKTQQKKFKALLQKKTNHNSSNKFTKDDVTYEISDEDSIINGYRTLTRSIQQENEDEISEINITIGSSDNLLKLPIEYNDLSSFENALMDIYTRKATYNIKDRIKKEVLDSLIKQELHLKSITTNYLFGVYNYDGESVFEDSVMRKKEVVDSDLFIKLFPHDIVAPPYYLTLYFPNENQFLIQSIGKQLLASLLLLLIIIAVVFFITRTLLQQKKISEIKNDFINNMTHELKTPISTISLACDVLHDTENNITDKQKEYLNIIKDENKRLKILVENVLKSSLWNKGNMQLSINECDIHVIIKSVIHHLKLQLEKNGTEIILELNAESSKLWTSEMHLTNIINNLLDNANKYSPNAGKIIVKTSNIDQGITLCISDNGLGIKKEDLNKIFDKFYRVPTGNIHTVKGFGLGLHYVKAITEKLAGTISVNSSYKKGSTFKVYFPFKH